jgi:5-methylcytosine-specific restriction endonuclease McrA
MTYPPFVKYFCHRYWRGTSHIGKWYYKQWWMWNVAKPLGLESFKSFLRKKRRRNKRYQKRLYGNGIFRLKKYQKQLKYDHCGICGQEFREGEKKTIDHIKPKHTHPELVYEISNMQLAHEQCNNLKGNLPPPSYRNRGLTKQMENEKN